MIIIPARFHSTRFPGKPLADIKGKSMIQRVVEQCQKTNQRVIVATDHDSIFNHVKQLGVEVYLTNKNHQSGTDRCAEIYKKTGSPDEIVVKVQGDEPFIQPEQIQNLIDLFNNSDVEIATLAKKIDDENTLFNENNVKLIKNTNGKAIYFSRSPIPFLKGFEKSTWHANHEYFKHVGVYAFRGDKINQASSLKQSSLELAESLEQLRWMENNMQIYVAETIFQSPSIDTPEDLKQVISSFLIK